MACNNMTCGRQNSSCWWTLVIIAAILVWMNCGCSINGTSCGNSGSGSCSDSCNGSCSCGY